MSNWTRWKPNALLWSALLCACGAEAPGHVGGDAVAPENDSAWPAAPATAPATALRPVPEQDSDPAAQFPEAEPTTVSQRVPCSAPAGVSGAPRNVEQAVALMNSLPRPTTLECFIESLQRPLEVYLTSSDLSLQPADGTRSPRAFLVRGDLVMSVVPNPEFSNLLELGYRSAPGRSMKGEVAFPLTVPVTASSILERIRVGDVSICGGCHGAETRPVDGFFADGAFESAIAVPLSPFEVPLEGMRQEAVACEPTREPERCGILSALFDHGEVVPSSLWD
jgi:hypothetical protein